MNKLSKNRAAPFPLLLKEIFALMDTRKVKRIDGMELYTIFLLLAKADYDSVLKCVVDVFGLE